MPKKRNGDNLEIRVYPVDNVKFVLYEDENDSYNYGKGNYSTITFSWDDKKKTLNLSGRNVSFPGTLDNRKFNIMLVNTTRGIGEKFS